MGLTLESWTESIDRSHLSLPLRWGACYAAGTVISYRIRLIRAGRLAIASVMAEPALVANMLCHCVNRAPSQ